ncbi:MAG: hypothetical protein ABEJ57_08610 [Halobacteriaceae archaeon]
MNCPTCGYDVDPSTGLRCPRCQDTLDCGAIDCGECGACSGLLTDLRSLFETGDPPTDPVDTRERSLDED